ncbi:S-layer homology domain-containing protein [Paenibacillus sp. yr247]|uniref:S-layer homology domain-containing protein n=1 Tax=Paenibacillus sp. yr247 TaxID=1761880 RepID=UPI0034A2986E
MRLFKLPNASNFYPNVMNDAWYSNSFIIAHFNGVVIPKDVNPSSTITREQFTKLLIPVLGRKYNLPMIKISANVKDQDQITPDIESFALRLIHYRITELDKDGNFLPKNELTRGEATTWVYNALHVTSAQKPSLSDKVTVSIEDE